MLFNKGLTSPEACWLCEGLASVNAMHVIGNRFGYDKVEILSQQVMDRRINLIDEVTSDFLETVRQYDFMKPIGKDHVFAKELRIAREKIAFYAMTKITAKTKRLYAFRDLFQETELASKDKVSYSEVKDAFYRFYNVSLESFFDEAKKEYVEAIPLVDGKDEKRKF
jgi:hypothetical protein